MSSNITSTSTSQTSDPPRSSTTKAPPSSTANPRTTASTPDPTTSVPSTSPTSDHTTPTPTTPSSSDPPTTSHTPTETHSEPPPSTSTHPEPTTPTETPTPTPTGTSTFTKTVTSPIHSKTDAPATVPTSSSTTTGAAINPTGSGSGGGLNNQGKIAVAVVVPIAAVALLVLAGIYLWRKRKQRREAAEQARKEVEDYGYNPNADPTIPAVAAGGGPFEMKEDASSGYRGWGSTTLAGSTGRKASTTMSGGGPAGVAYSDATSPTRGNVSDTRSGEPLMNDGSQSPEGEILGAMGPSAAGNRADVHRGPSNASSSYSAAGRSDGSGEGGIGTAYGGGPGYYDQYENSNPYTDGRPGGPEPPVIRDVTARRNTRIENSSHYPQQSAGISQNF